MKAKGSIKGPALSGPGPNSLTDKITVQETVSERSALPIHDEKKHGAFKIAGFPSVEIFS